MYEFSNKKGFTLIELLVVIAIIGILAAAAIPRVMDAICDARVSRIKSDISTIRTALAQAISQDNMSLSDINDSCYNLSDDCAVLSDYLPKRLLGSEGPMRIRNLAGDGLVIDINMPDGCSTETEVDGPCPGSKRLRYYYDKGQFGCVG